MSISTAPVEAAPAAAAAGLPAAVAAAGARGEGEGANAHDGLMLAAFRAITPTLAQLPSAVGHYDALSAGAVLEIQREISTLRRLLESRAVLIAGQVVRRSAPELGSAGLAQSGGFRTPEELVRVITGSTAADARRAVRVAVAVDEGERGGRVDHVTGELFAPAHPWLNAAARAVAAGALSIDSAMAISNGLGDTTDTVTVTMLTDAVTTLLRHAHVGGDDPDAGAAGVDGAHPLPVGTLPVGPLPLDADRLYRLARELRDELDAAGVAEREEHRRAARSLRLYKRPDGTARLVWEMDPETLTIVGECFDQLTSPRRGGPRFVARDGRTGGGTGGGTSGGADAELTDSQAREAERAEKILADNRTVEQLASDGFLDLLRVAVDTAPTALIGVRRPAVRVVVTDTALRARSGHGRVEGQADLISLDTVERIACTDGIQSIVIDAFGQPLDVGREQRLYTYRQRIALAVRDGGCRWPGCDRPPAWTEAHHIHHWDRDGGSTDVADGILLCRHHHLLAHNNGWEITRDGATFWLIPPPGIDPKQRPIPMPSKSGAVRDALRDAARGAVPASPSAATPTIDS